MAIVKDLGMVTAYAYAVAGGYEGTEAEFTELLGQAGITLEQLENLAAVATTLSEGSEATASYSDGVLTFGIPRGNTGATGPQGPQGVQGETGNGIASITKTGTSGLVDTYTITFTDGTTTTFTVANGADGDITNVAQAFDATKAYSVGDMVLYQGTLYAFTAAHAAGAWVGSDAQAVILADEVTELKDDLEYKGELKSGYITYQNGVYHSSTSRQYMEFPVSYGMSVLYRFNDGAAYNIGLAFYDADGKYISGAIAQSQPQIVDVPEKCVLCKATARNKDDSVPIYLNSAIQKNRIRAFKSIEIDNNLFEYQTDKYAYWNRATVTNYTGINVLVFPVFEGLTFVYSLKNSNPNNVGLHFKNSIGGYVSGVQATANPTTVATPPTATVCYASVYNRSDVAFTSVGNALLSAVNNDINCGLQTNSEPLETITDVTGMLDIFLNVGCIGDSLASGESYWNDGGTNQGADFYQYSWGQYLARKTGNKYYNWSRGGLSTKLWLQSEYATECFDGQHLCEAYIIGLGQNDANYNYTIGTSADIDLANYNNNADTFYGSYGKIIQRIKEVQPQAKIFVITDPNTTTDTKGYNTAIRNIATIFDNVYVVDMRTYALKYMQSPVLIAQLRAGHFNAYGYKVFSMMIANYIDWIVTTNYTEFTQVELIGTGHTWTS